MEILPLATREGTHHSTVAVRFSDHQDQLISMWTTCIAESQVAAGFYVFLPDGFSGLLRPVLGLVARQFSGWSPASSRVGRSPVLRSVALNFDRTTPRARAREPRPGLFSVGGHPLGSWLVQGRVQQSLHESCA